MSADAKAVAAATGKVRVALCQLLVSADKSKNLQSTAEAVRKAHAEHKPDIIVLPEIWNGAYSNDAFPTDAETIASDATKADPKTQPSSHLISALAKELKVTIVGGSISEREFVDTGAGVQQRLYNTCLVADPSGAFIAKHRKVHLFDIDIPGKITFRESLTLTAGSAYTVCDAPVHGGTAVLRIGVGICYDMRFAEYAMVCAQQYGVRAMVYPGAFNTTTGPLHWELLQRARALDNQLFVVTCSPARNPDSKYQAWGHSTAVGPSGDVLATTEHGAALVVTELELARVDELRATIPIGKQKRHDLYAPPTATAAAAAATALANGVKPIASAPPAAAAAAAAPPAAK